MMLEPDVTITDYILAFQTVFFAVYLYKKFAHFSWLFFFGSLAMASLAGGTVHGYCSIESLMCRSLWKATLIAVGSMTLAAWYIGANFIENPRITQGIKKLAMIQFCVFSLVILFYSQKFLIAALNYLPAAIFLLAVFTYVYSQNRQKALLFGVISILLTFLGSAIQIMKIPLHPNYFNHNALYHIIQFFALCLLFMTAKWDIDRRKNETREQNLPT